MTRVLLAATALLLFAGEAAAQVSLRGFADVGSTTFAAKESFSAITGTNSGIVFGGGAEVGGWSGLFVSVRASRFKKDGERVFLFEGQRFALGVPVTITITPVEVSGGWRFNRGGAFAPYAAGGIGFHRYRETSDFAIEGEDVDERFTGLQVLGGLEARLTRLIAAAGEVQWTSVPDALGSDPNSVAASFDEHDLGGLTVRVKVVIGR
jgi:hypothetical protein